MKCLAVSVVLLVLIAEGIANEVLVNNRSTNRTQFCVGETLTLTCGKSGTTVYQWSISTITGVITASSGLPLTENAGFTVRFDDATSTTTIKFTFANNNINVTCTDVGRGVSINTFDLQSLGEVPAPTITSVTGTMESFIVNIMPVDTMCMTGYVISVLESNNVVHNQSVEVQDGSSTAAVMVNNVMNNLRPCDFNYTFQVRATISTMSSNEVTGMISYADVGRVNFISSGGDSLSWSPPAGLTGCTLSYQVSLQISNITLDTSSPSVSKSSLEVTSPCLYDNVTVTPIVRTQSTPLHQSSATTAVSRGSIQGNVNSMNDTTLVVIIEVEVGDQCSGYYVQAMSDNRTINITQEETMVAFSIQDNTPCELLVLSPDFGVLDRTSIFCGTTTPVPTTVTTSATPTSDTDTPTTPGTRNIVPIVAGTVGGVGGAALVGSTLLGAVLAYKFSKSKRRKDGVAKLKSSSGGQGTYDDVDAKHGTAGATSHDNLQTYQDPNTIQREAAGPSGDVYTVVAKPKKGSKKNGQSEELPMYSVVDKNAKKEQDGLVYADIDVKNPTRSSRSRPPPPPGVTQPDANEPVVYSTVDTAKH